MNSDAEKIISWPLRIILPAYAAGFILYFTFVPMLDGKNGPRLTFFALLSVLFWARFIIARYRHEHSRVYALYAALIILSPFIWIGIEEIFL